MGNSTETNNLKALALKVLQRNQQGNSKETHEIKPLIEVMFQKYGELAEWLHNHDLTSDEIKDLPDVYDAIQKAIEDMDNTFYAEDLQGFLEASERVKRLYQGAMATLKRERQEP